MKCSSIFLLLVILSADLFSQPGTLDTDFGQNGIITKAFNAFGSSRIYSTAIQSDGKIIAAGPYYINLQADFSVTRFNPDGTLDNTFGLNGTVITSFGLGSEHLFSVAVQSDGRIVAGGSCTIDTCRDFLLVRYNPDGSLDQTFGSGGKVITQVSSSHDAINSIGIQPDGKIVAAGSAFGWISYDIALVRYCTDGTLDPSFGTGGIVTLPALSEESISSISIQPNGKIVAGCTSDFAGSYDFTVVRFNEDGTLDDTFGTGGIVITISEASEDILYSTALQSDGKIIAAGSSDLFGSKDFALVRYNSNGSLDETFGLNGIVISIYGTSIDIAYHASIQSDGKIVLTGTAQAGYSDAFATVRYNQNGTLDTTFGTNGAALTQIINSGQEARAGLIQSDGKVIAAGFVDTLGHTEMVLLRYTSEGIPDITFGRGGIVQAHAGLTLNEAYSAALQTDGKIIAGGYTANMYDYDFALVRLTNIGVPDTLFGTSGKVITPIGASDDKAYTIVLQPDGKIIAAGSSENGSNTAFSLARFNSDGTLDGAFGTAGKIITDIGTFAEAYKILIQEDGKILAGGYTYNDINLDFAIVRYNADGELDNTFDTDGIVTTPVGGSNDILYSMALQSDGKIIAAGSVEIGNGTQFALVRYNPDGTLDNLFGAGGIVKTSIGLSSTIHSIMLQSDGKITAGGYSFQDNNYNFALARYNSDGTLDISFGSNGISVTHIETDDSQINSIVIQPNEKIVAAGFCNKSIALVRYDQNGIIDPSFGIDGIVSTPVATCSSVVNSVLLQSDGKIIAAGCASETVSTFSFLSCVFTIIRYNGDPPVNVKNENSEMPASFVLEQNFPNPFNPITNIGFSIPFDAYVTLKLYDILGKETAVLLSEQKTAGTYDISFNAADLSAGVYFYRLQTENFIDTKKFLLIK